jgi:hypothetical protein
MGSCSIYILCSGPIARAIAPPLDSLGTRVLVPL